MHKWEKKKWKDTIWYEIEVPLQGQFLKYTVEKYHYELGDYWTVFHCGWRLGRHETLDDAFFATECKIKADLLDKVSKMRFKRG